MSNRGRDANATEASSPSGPMTPRRDVLFLGDMMPGGALLYQRELAVDPEVQTFLSEHSLRIATLECALGQAGSGASKPNIVFAPQSAIRVLRSLRVDVVSLANNHAGDLGGDILLRTIEQLEAAGIRTVGAGRNADAANAPLVVRVNDFRLGVLAYVCVGLPDNIHRVLPAAPDSPGVAVFNERDALAAISRVRHFVDAVVVLMHWGSEYTWFPPAKNLGAARKLVDAGCDLVVGTHAHRAQPCFNHRNSVICAGLGNFLFPSFAYRPKLAMFEPSSLVEFRRLPAVSRYRPTTHPVRREWGIWERCGMALSAGWMDGSFRCSARFLQQDEPPVSIRFADERTSGRIRRIHRLVRLVATLPGYRFIFPLTVLPQWLKRVIYMRMRRTGLYTFLRGRMQCKT